jgi:hypothetical protein
MGLPNSEGGHCDVLNPFFNRRRHMAGGALSQKSLRSRTLLSQKQFLQCGHAKVGLSVMQSHHSAWQVL